MEESILTTIKQTLGLDADYAAFDLDIITYINSTLSILDQLGIGPEGGVFISDATEEWESLGLPPVQLNAVKTYIGLKVRMLFDPPTTGFLKDAMERQIAEFESRLNIMREVDLYEPVDD